MGLSKTSHKFVLNAQINSITFQMHRLEQERLLAQINANNKKNTNITKRILVLRRHLLDLVRRRRNAN